MSAGIGGREFCGAGGVEGLMGRRGRGMIRGRARRFAAEWRQLRVILRRLAELRRVRRLREWLGLPRAARAGSMAGFQRRSGPLSMRLRRAGFLFGDEVLRGGDQLREAADFEVGILQSGEGEASIVARPAIFFHLSGSRMTLAHGGFGKYWTEVQLREGLGLAGLFKIGGKEAGYGRKGGRGGRGVVTRR